MEELDERLELGAERLREWVSEGEAEKLPEAFRVYMLKQAELLEHVLAVYRNPKTMANAEVNKVLYADIIVDAYQRSFTNPGYCCQQFRKEYGDKTAQCLNWIATNMRDVIKAAYEKDTWTIVVWLELFLELIGILTDSTDGNEDSLAGSLKELIYYFIHDYDEIRLENRIREMLIPDEESLTWRLVMNRDHSDLSYLYEYGEYIGMNEITSAAVQMSIKIGGSRFFKEDYLESMARAYTEGYRRGFEAAGIDLSEKKTVEIRFPIGFEPMVKKAVTYFREMGLEPTFRRLTNTQNIGIISTPPNRQYLHDHRFDDALYMNQALMTERLKHARCVFEKYADEAFEYAGPAVIETFGEDPFSPGSNPEAPKYTSEQEKISLAYKRDYALMQDEFIPGDKRSFTIISFPVQEIGEQYSKIFKDTVRINALDEGEYRRIHQAIIDVLDTGEYVLVKGKNGNRTDMKVMLHRLEDPSKQTNFENCLADVNIPVGEVFTSPVLSGTEGTLHVSSVFLNGLQYKDLCLYFKDGMVKEYSCGNYDDPEEGKAYIKENILHNHETLPIGEFAIGTNTSAYVMGKKYDIEDRLPILIAEKTGPHFAVGDTCYSFSEDVVVRNPDGKEIIAKDNECSILRKEDPSKAYFQCHTDITIPYDELGSISVFTKEGKETIIIRDGRFVLPGTEDLNKPLDSK